MSDHRRTPTMAGRVETAFAALLPAVLACATARSALMYAEAIDDDDEGDGLHRFGPRLHTALEALGLAPVALALGLPRPVVGRADQADPADHQADHQADQQRHLAAVGSPGTTLAA